VWCMVVVVGVGQIGQYDVQSKKESNLNYSKTAVAEQRSPVEFLTHKVKHC